MGKQYKHLFSQGKIGTMELKNRIVMAPMSSRYHDKGGYVSQRLIDYLEARARGGVGLIIIEYTAASVQCNASKYQLTLGDDSYVPGFKKLAEVVHQYGTKIAVQLHHGGWEIRDGNIRQVGPSPVVVPARVMGLEGAPHELTPDEIGERVKWHARAAGLAREAGLDGVEIHAAHQYLLASFLSPSTNQRTDKYGGTLENRAGFLAEIIKATRDVVGHDFPVWARLNGQEYGFDGGVTIEDTKQIVPILEEAGANALHISGYGAYSSAIRAPICDIPGYLISNSAEVKKVSKVPVIAVGRLDAELGEKILEEGTADFISLGRRLIADPGLPNKVAEGRLNDITPCINCMECLDRPIKMDAIERQGDLGISCSVNAAAGREGAFKIHAADTAVKVLVVGGGPAGMQAAIVAARRGHQVVLFEKTSELGGQLGVAKIPPHKEELAGLVEFMGHQLNKLDVDIHLNTEVTPEMILEANPGGVIIAAGSAPILPDIPGISHPHVFTAQEVLAGQEVGENVVVIGGGMVGCETGLFLSAKAKQIRIVEMLKRFAGDMPMLVRRRLLDELREKQVMMMKNTTCLEIIEDGILVKTDEGEQQKIPADSIILAVGYHSDDKLFSEIKDKLPKVYNIGDSAEPKRIKDAIKAGYEVGLSL